MPEHGVNEMRLQAVQRLVMLLAENRFATLSSALAQAFDAGYAAERRPPVAYVHRAADGTETTFQPSEIWTVREGVNE